MIANRSQSKISISGLTYNNLLEDAYNALKDTDAFKDNFTSFTSNSAERMIVELYAYMATQLANRLDQMGNEMFVDTASASGMSRLLKLVGAKVDFPSAATVSATVSTSTQTGDLTFTTGIDASGGSADLAYTSGTFKSVTASNGTNWEFIDYEVGNDGEYVYDYTTSYTFTAPSQTYTLCEGTTRALEYTINSVNTDIITLTGYPVINNSVRVYYKAKTLSASSYVITEMTKVDNFFTTEAITAETGIYTVRNMGNGRCELCIKPYYNDSTAETDLGKELLIMYRVGGGADGNISIGAIDTTERFATTNSTNRTTGYGLLNIYNSETGAGGVDELTTDEIRATVLQEVRNTKIAITEEDYEYLLPKYDSTIELLKCYGEKNDDIADLAETYGYYTNPLSVWLIILKYNKEFYDAYMSGETALTDRINDIAFSVLDVNPRFNEEYQINKAYLNQHFTASTLSEYFVEDEHIYSFPIDSEGVDLLADGSCLVTVTHAPYLESSSSSRRGANCFNRYTGEATQTTWDGLMELSEASVGDAYLITDEDVTGVTNDRWICIQAFTSAIDEDDYADYWKMVDFSYPWDNLVALDDDENIEDRMYVEQSSTDIETFDPSYSYINSSFTMDWSVITSSDYYDESTDSIIFPADSTIFTINGQQVVISPSTATKYTAEDLADTINNLYSPTTNIIYLKENISTDLTSSPASETISSNSSFSSTGTSTMVLTIGNGSAVNVAVTVASSMTYGTLLDNINSAISSSSLSGKVLAVFIEYNSCWNLALICADSFTYTDLSTELSVYSSLYVYLLNNDESNLPLSSSTYVPSSDELTEWADYLSGVDDICEVDSNGNIVFYFDDGECSLYIESGDGSFQALLRNAFGVDTDSDEATYISEKRTITVSYSEDAGTAYLQITTTAIDDLLEDDIYINIFGGLNEEIQLGEYYENIEDHLTDVSSVITDLLKRDAIKYLYSTSFITDDDTSTVDIYGSDYQLKLSTKVIQEQTYNQLSAGNSPAYVTTTRIATDPATLYYAADTTYLYIKVDNTEYDGTGTFTLNGTTYTVPEYNGYARFDLSWFNSCNTLSFTTAIVETFYKQGENGTPMLYRVAMDDNTEKIYTASSSFYSSIDFGETLITVLYNLFGISSTTVSSEEGQIDATQITYKYYSLSDSLAIGQSFTLAVTPEEGGTTESDTISVGYSLTNLTNNIAASSVGDYVTVDNGRIILTELTNGADITLTVDWTSQLQYDTWEAMFSSTTWDDFTKTDATIASITWDDLMAISTASAGDIYQITDEDPNGDTGSYWKCITAAPSYTDTTTWDELLVLSSAAFGDIYLVTDKDMNGNVYAIWNCLATPDYTGVTTWDELLNSSSISAGDTYLVTDEDITGKAYDIWECTTAPDYISAFTWDELLALESAAVDDTYLITDEDGTGNTGVVWKCTQAFSSQISSSDYANYWEVNGKTYTDYWSTSTTYANYWSSSKTYADYWEVTGYTGSATCTYTNDGDYYIRVDKDDDDNYTYYFVVQNDQAFPYGSIYFHMYEDYSNDHIVSGSVDDGDAVYTDEYTWNNLMTDKRVMLTEHIYKQPRFIPFDLDLTCYISNTEALSLTDYSEEIEAYLREEYGIYSNNIGEEILADDIILNIKENFPKVLKVTVNYLGYDILNSSSTQDSLETEFNQKHILASTASTSEMITDSETGLVSIENVISQGLKLTIKYKAS